MKNKLFLYMFIALALVLSVMAVGNINIQEATISVSGNPGATNTSVAATVQNTGAQQLDNILMNATDLTGASGNISKSAVSFFSSSFSLNASGSYANALIVTIPSGQKAGVYTGTINAVHNTSHMDSASLQVTVNEVSDFTLTSNTPSIVKGSSGQITVNVTNTGNADITGATYSITTPFTSGADVLNPGSTSGSVNVNHASSNSFNIAFSPGVTQASGTYSGQVNVTYKGTTKTITASVIVKDPEYKIDLPDVVHSQSEREKNVSTQVTITNNGDFTLTGVTLTTSTSASTVSGTVPSTFVKGSSFTVTVTTAVPKTADSGVSTIGTLNFNSNEHSKTSNIKTDAKTMLEFDYVKVAIDDNSWDKVNEGSTADDDARPGDTFEVRAKLENLFDDNDQDYDIDNVEITAIFHGAGEGGDDIDGDSDSFDIKASDKSDEIDITFDDDIVDWDADDGKLLVELIAEGEDDNGANHEARFNFSINVERENRAEIVFSRLDATSNVNCGGTLTIYADGRNIGKKSDDEVVLKLKGDNFNLDQRVEFEMGAYDDDDDCNALDADEDECMEFQYKASIKVPTGISSQTYTITGELYRDDANTQTDEETVDVKVTCSAGSSSSSSSSSSGSSSETSSGTSSTSGTSSGSSSGSSTTSSGSTTTEDTSDTSGETTSSVQILYSGGDTAPSSQGVVASTPTKISDLTDKSGFGDSKGYLALLSVLSVLAIIGIVVMLIVAFTSPRV